MHEDIFVGNAVLDIEEEIDTTIIPRFIDDINTMFQQLWGIEIFRSRLIPLGYIITPCKNDPIDFDIHVASLGNFIDSLDGKSLKQKIPKEIIRGKYSKINCQLVSDKKLEDELKTLFQIVSDDVILIEWRPLQSIDYLLLFLECELRESDNLIQKLRDIRRLRNTVPLVHTLYWKEIEKALTKFNVEYPIMDFQRAWLKIIKEFIESLKQLRSLLEAEKRLRRNDE